MSVARRTSVALPEGQAVPQGSLAKDDILAPLVVPGSPVHTLHAALADAWGPTSSTELREVKTISVARLGGIGVMAVVAWTPFVLIGRALLG